MTHQAETDEIVAEFEQAGLIEIYVNEEGREAYRLNEQGARVSRQLAMPGDDEGEGLMAALLDSRRPCQLTTSGSGFTQPMLRGGSCQLSFSPAAQSTDLVPPQGVLHEQESIPTPEHEHVIAHDRSDARGVGDARRRSGRPVERG